MRIGLAVASFLSFAAGSILVLSGVGGILESWEAGELLERHGGQLPLQLMSFDGPEPLTLSIFLDCAKWATIGFVMVASSIGVWRSPHRVWGWMMIAPLALFVVLRSVDLWLLTVHSDGWFDPTHYLIEPAVLFAWFVFTTWVLHRLRKL